MTSQKSELAKFSTTILNKYTEIDKENKPNEPVHKRRKYIRTRYKIQSLLKSDTKKTDSHEIDKMSTIKRKQYQFNKEINIYINRNRAAISFSIFVNSLQFFWNRARVTYKNPKRNITK